MTVTRINNFQAQPGEGDALSSLLNDVLPPMKDAAGFISYEILQSMDDPVNIVVVEVWRSSEDHQAAAAAIPREDFQKVMALMSGPPSGAYYVGRNRPQ